MTTPAATWPDPANPGVPENPDRTARHWVRLFEGGAEIVLRWIADQGGMWAEPGFESPSCFAGDVYLGPVLTPVEAQALRTRAETAEASDAETCRMFNANQVETAERGLRIEALTAERDGLAAEVAALRATPKLPPGIYRIGEGMEAGLEKAALWHEAEAERCTRQIEQARASGRTQALADWQQAAAGHRSHAQTIRALASRGGA